MAVSTHLATAYSNILQNKTNNINSKLDTISDALLDIRKTINGFDSTLGNGTVDTLGDDIRILNGKKYIWKWINNNGAYVLQKDYYQNAIPNNAYKNNTNIVAVIIPDTITSIGDYAFDGCTNLVFVYGEGSPTIGTNAFSNSEYIFNNLIVE